MKRYYDLIEGKVRGSYAAPQPDKELTLLPSAPDDESMWNGSMWIPDPDIVAAREAEEARIAAKLADFASELPSWATIRDEINAIGDAAKAATTINQLGKVVNDLAVHYRRRMKILYWLVKDKAV